MPMTAMNYFFALRIEEKDIHQKVFIFTGINNSHDDDKADRSQNRSFIISRQWKCNNI